MDTPENRHGIRKIPLLLAAGIGLALGACGGGAAQPSPPPPPVVVSPPPPPDFSAVTAEIERHPIADMALIVGDADGPLLSYEKGAFSTDDPIRLASASKLLTGLGVWKLIEEGVLAESDRPADSLAVWSGTDARADITLGQLMSFTSGLNTAPFDPTCAGRLAFSLEACVGEIHDRGVATAPGSTFYYGPDHMQVAALMAETASGEPLSETLRTRILDPVGASASTGFLRGENVRYSGGADGTANDYALILRALLAGELLDDTTAFARPRSRDAEIGFQPTGLEVSGRDWRYGFGFWVECDAVPFNDDCESAPTLSSAGARGFVPWVDLDAGYWAIIAMEEDGQADDSTELQQILQPMIEDVLR